MKPTFHPFILNPSTINQQRSPNVEELCHTALGCFALGGVLYRSNLVVMMMMVD